MINFFPNIVIIDVVFPSETYKRPAVRIMEDCVTVTQEKPQNNLLSKQLFSDTDFTDVTLVSKDGLHISVHRAVLCASSLFLRALLLESLQQNTFLYLGPVDHQVLEVLVEFVYFGRCKVPRSRVGDLRALAKQLGVKLLEQAVEKFDDAKPQQKLEIPLDSRNTEADYVPEGKAIEDASFDTFADNIIDENDKKCHPNFDMPVHKVKIKVENDADFRRAKLYERLPKIKIASPNSEGIYACKKCDKSFQRWSKLKSHILVVHEGYLFKCTKCSGEFGSIMKIESHHIKDHNLKPYMCDICQNTFPQQRGLENHKSQELKKCDQCDFMGCNKKILAVHTYTHDPMFENAKFNCSQCPYQNRKKSNITNHMRIVHEKIQDHFCDQCTFKSSHKYRVDAHVRSFHLGIKLHCNLCEYTAVSKKMIKIHTSKKHDGIRYECDLCENKYTSNVGLRDHVKANHIKERLTCPHCGLVISYKSSFNRHMKQHSEEKKERRERKPKNKVEKCDSVDCCKLNLTFYGLNPEQGLEKPHR